MNMAANAGCAYGILAPVSLPAAVTVASLSTVIESTSSNQSSGRSGKWTWLRESAVRVLSTPVDTNAGARYANRENCLTCQAKHQSEKLESSETILQQGVSCPNVTRRLVTFGTATLVSSATPGLGDWLSAAFAEEIISELDTVTAPGAPRGEDAPPSEAPAATSRLDSAEPAEGLGTLEEPAATTGSTGPGRPDAELADSAGATLDEKDSRNGEPLVTRKVYFDVSIEGEPIGRIVVGLFEKDVPIGAARFAELAAGNRGVSYRRKEFTKVFPGYIQNAGLRSFSLTGGDRDAAQFSGGETADKLVAEMGVVSRNSPSLKHVAGTISLVVIDPTIPPPKTKLVARDGGFVTVVEAGKPPPNGTEFAIVTKDSPELDSTNLVVGKVLDGWNVVEAIAKVPTVKENKSSPYFMAAKMIGDSRAVVAERGFNRPYVKIVITKCGEVS